MAHPIPPPSLTDNPDVDRLMCHAAIDVLRLREHAWAAGEEAGGDLTDR